MLNRPKSSLENGEELKKETMFLVIGSWTPGIDQRVWVRATLPLSLLSFPKEERKTDFEKKDPPLLGGVPVISLAVFSRRLNQRESATWSLASISRAEGSGWRKGGRIVSLFQLFNP
jgi:hypothetical protein